MESNFLFGAVYIIEQDYTDEEMRRDLTNMRDCGFNLITLWPIGNALSLIHIYEEFVLSLQSLYDLAATGAFNSDVNSIDGDAQRAAFMNGQAAIMLSLIHISMF